MAKSSLSDADQVADYILGLDEPIRETVGYLRTLFLSVSDEISEHIKWNSPAFYFNGVMADFDPKLYKRDLAVINVHRGKILVVFPTGTKIDDSILPGKHYPDGRKVIEIAAVSEAERLSDKLKSGIKSWLSLIER